MGVFRRVKRTVSFFSKSVRWLIFGATVALQSEGPHKRLVHPLPSIARISVAVLHSENSTLAAYRRFTVPGAPLCSLSNFPHLGAFQSPTPPSDPGNPVPQTMVGLDDFLLGGRRSVAWNGSHRGRRGVHVGPQCVWSGDENSNHAR